MVWLQHIIFFKECRVWFLSKFIWIEWGIVIDDVTEFKMLKKEKSLGVFLQLIIIYLCQYFISQSLKSRRLMIKEVIPMKKKLILIGFNDSQEMKSVIFNKKKYNK